MRSYSSSSNFSHLGFLRPRKCYSLPSSQLSRFLFDPSLSSHRLSSCFKLKLSRSNVRRYGYCSKHRLVQVTAMDEGSFDSFSFNELGDNEGSLEYMFSSSEGEESDGEIILQPITDVDLPTKREQFRHDDALTVAAHRLTMIGRAQKKKRSKYGILNNLGLITFLTVLLSLVDWCAWRIVRLPLDPFYLMRPFCISAALVSFAGYVGVPMLHSLKIQSIIRKEQPFRHSSKKGTPTMGGLLFVPVGIIVAEVIVGFSSIEVSAAVAATLAFAIIGLLDDCLSLIKNQNNGLPALMRLILEVVVGILFSLWLYSANISSPYRMKLVVPLPAPLGLICLGKNYLFFNSFCFAFMGNGIDLTDSLDGLAGGTAALAFMGMSIAVLPICPELAIFGASMTGACVGFLLHNRYKASVFMGDTGALALGGALAAMAACTGMFFPLFISSGFFVLEALSVLMQVAFFKTSKCLQGTGRRLFRMTPFHYHLALSGFKEPAIVAGAYVVSCVLALSAGYVGLISA